MVRNILASITQWSVLSSAFLIPVFWSPFTFEAFESAKLILLVSLMSLGILSWGMKMVFCDKVFVFKRTPLDLPILFLLIISIVSWVLSLDRWASLFGYYGRFSDSVLLIFSYIAFYILINNAQERPWRVVKWFLVGTFWSLLISLLSVFGFWKHVSFVPIIMQKEWFNPTSASMEGFSIFISCILVFLCARAIRSQVTQLPSVSSLLLVFSSVAILVASDVSTSWIVLLVGLGFVLVQNLYDRIKKKEGLSLGRLWLPFSLVLVSLLFLFGAVSLVRNEKVEPRLSQGISWQIAFGTIGDNAKSLFVGSGPGTFALDFSLHRPDIMNMTPQWQTRFDRAGSAWAELIATLGVFGLLSYIALFGFFILSSWLFWKGPLAPFAAVVFALSFAHILYYQTISLGFAFWMFLAVGVALLELPRKEIRVDFRKFVEVGVIARGVLFVFFILVGWAAVLGARFVYADTLYLKAQNAVGQDKIAFAEKAVQANSHQGEYKMYLSRLYVQRALGELAKPEAERDQAQVSKDIQLAIAQGRGDIIEGKRIKGAIEVDPARVASWETLGAMYRDIQFATGALEWAVKSFGTAISLEPSNPALHTELGKIYAEKKDFEKAKQQFEIALKVKSDYIDASRQLALLFERQGNMAEAVSLLFSLVSLNPQDIESLFQLGRLEYNEGKVNEAIGEFMRVLDIAPNHSNALFALGTALEKQGKIKEALVQFKKVLQLNPDSQDVKAKILRLAPA